MTEMVQLYWSFRSPYSYIILPRIVGLQLDFDVEIDLRVVHPAAIRNPTYFDRMDPLARPYFLADSARMAAYHGLPFRRPIPDPIEQDSVTLSISNDQQLAISLGRLGIAAVEHGKGLSFAVEISKLLWDGTVTGWNVGNHLAQATARVGIELSELEATVAKDPSRYDGALLENDHSLRQAGHWGVPTMVFNNEIFFGQDRIDVLAWRLSQSGLRRATADILRAET